MMQEVDLLPVYADQVREILTRNLPMSASIWLFGSRALGTAKKYSDIDLLIDIKRPLSLAELAQLSAAFEESTLPYKVDIVDAATISQEFRDNLSQQIILFLRLP